MLTNLEAIYEFSELADSLIEKLKPVDAEEIIPGMETYKQSYEFDMLQKRNDLKLELATYIDTLLPKLDSSIDRDKLSQELVEIGKQAYLKFTDTYWKSRQTHEF